MKRRFQLKMEILRLRENCLQEPFSDVADKFYLLARQGEITLKVSLWKCTCVRVGDVSMCVPPAERDEKFHR